VTQEGATVVILNGSDVIGLAKLKKNRMLTSQGFDVAGIADASQETRTA